MSWTIIKGVFELRAAAFLTPDERTALWNSMMEELIDKHATKALHCTVPSKVVDIQLRRRQGELLMHLPNREAAEKLGCSPSTAWRDRELFQSRTGSETDT